MNQEILDDPKPFLSKAEPTLKPLKSSSIQLGFASLSFILYFIGFSIYITAELGIGIIILLQFALNPKSRQFSKNNFIAILRFLGASMILISLFFIMLFHYGLESIEFSYYNSTTLLSRGLVTLVLYFFIWALSKDIEDYFFQFTKLMQGASLASFCWGIRSYITGESRYWFLISFVCSIVALLLLLVYVIRNKKMHHALLIHLPLVIWTVIIELAFICTKIF
jgi:hypothetical protein